MVTPLTDQDLCFSEAVEDLAIEQLVSQLAVKAFAAAVLLGTAQFDVQGFRADV